METPAPTDEPVVLVERRSRSVRLLITSVVLLAGSLLTVSTNGPDAGWVGLAFFVPCTAVFTFNLVKPPRLILTRRGFRFVNLWRTSPLFEWHLVRGFHPFSVAFGTTLIAFTYDGHWGGWRGLLGRANRSLTDGNAALPTTYGMRPQDLVDVLERWRQMAAGKSDPGAEEQQPVDSRSSSGERPAHSAGAVSNHTAEVWHVIDNQTPPTFTPYFVAHCACGWVGFARSGRRAEERARQDAVSHTPDVAPGLRRPVG